MCRDEQEGKLHDAVDEVGDHALSSDPCGGGKVVVHVCEAGPDRCHEYRDAFAAVGGLNAEPEQG